MRPLARWPTALSVLAVLAGMAFAVILFPPLLVIVWALPIAVGVSIRHENPQAARALYALGAVLALLLFLLVFGLGEQSTSGYPTI